MIKRYLILFFLISLCSQAFCQYESAGMPVKFTLNEETTTYNLKRSVSNFFIDIQADTTNFFSENKYRNYTTGVTSAVDISVKDGISFTEDDVKIYRVGLRSKNAKGIALYFDKFLLPDGGKLFVYNPEQTIVFGAFTSENNNEKNTLLVRPLASDSIVVEYQEPIDVTFEADLHISLATHELRAVNEFLASNLCSPHATQEEKTKLLKQSVCMLYMVGPTSSYLGSGALINNAEHKPYVYTAGHNLTDAEIATKTIYYFNYEVPEQDSTFQGARQFTISGAKLISRDDDVDFALAELNKMPPAHYRPYMAGWTRKTPKAPFMCIQHPYGDVKKVSYTENNLSTTYFDNTRFNTYWKVSKWNKGVTEVGSSGSPLFDADGYIVGELTGGNSYCDTPVNDYFCKFSESWDYYSDKTKQIACYIDPMGTDVMSMEGYDPYSVHKIKRVSNVIKGDKIANYTVNDTPLVGHTSYGFTKYAEKFELENPVDVYGVYIMPFKGKYNASLPITVEIYSGLDKPEVLLSSVLVHPTEAFCSRGGVWSEKEITNFGKQELYIPLTKPVKVEENLFVALSIKYEGKTSSDSFSMASVLGEGKNTAYFYDENWKSFNEHPYSSLDVSIWVEPVIGKTDVVSIDEVDEENAGFAVYPNPTSGDVYISPTYSGNYRLYNLAGNLVETNVFNNKISLPAKGFYILELLLETGAKETHKLICY